MLRFDLVTIFPDMVRDFVRFGVTGRALERGLWAFDTHDPRSFVDDPYRRIDDRPYGGGPGMVMMAAPLADAIAAARACGSARRPVVAMSPQGRRFDDAMAREFAQGAGCILVAGRYEGIDQRLLDRHVDLQLSIGDFVLSGGELAALAVMDAVIRLLPGALSDADSAAHDSFADGLLDHPHYTRPETFEGEGVPEVLLSGHHARISRWRRDAALRATAASRPDLIERARAEGRLDATDEKVLASVAIS